MFNVFMFQTVLIYKQSVCVLMIIRCCVNIAHIIYCDSYKLVFSSRHRMRWMYGMSSFIIELF